MSDQFPEDPAAAGWSAGSGQMPSPNVRQTMQEMTDQMQTVIEAAERAADAIRSDAEEQARRHLAEAQRKADRLTAERVGLISELTDDLIRHAANVRDHSERMVRALEDAINSVTDKLERPGMTEPFSPGIGPGPSLPFPERSGEAGRYEGREAAASPGGRRPFEPAQPSAAEAREPGPPVAPGFESLRPGQGGHSPAFRVQRAEGEDRGQADAAERPAGASSEEPEPDVNLPQPLEGEAGSRQPPPPPFSPTATPSETGADERETRYTDLVGIQPPPVPQGPGASTPPAPGGWAPPPPPPGAPPPPSPDAAPPPQEPPVGADGDSTPGPSSRPAPPPPPPVPESDPDTEVAVSQDALLHASRMVISGEDREAIAQVLRNGYGIKNPGPILDRVLPEES